MSNSGPSLRRSPSGLLSPRGSLKSGMFSSMFQLWTRSLGSSAGSANGPSTPEGAELRLRVVLECPDGRDGVVLGPLELALVDTKSSAARRQASSRVLGRW